MSYQAKDKARYSRAQWMERFETECIKLVPKMRGRIDWGTAEFFYLRGRTPADAAKAWLSRQPEELV
jgi:hypothetical protein